jgi:hypothetical protein
MKLTRWDNETIHESKHVTIKECVEDAIKQGVSLYRIDLMDADLRCADLTGADLTGANMVGADLRCADLDYSSWPLWCGSCRVKLDKENNERFAYHAMINMDEDVLAEFLQNPVEFANRFAERKGISKIKAGEK